jgi:UDP-N-acetylmuramoyl-tripeptide--D-alanyl-D-alanine ligase
MRLPGMLGGTLVTVDLGDSRLCYSVAAPGEHWVINSLAVMATVRAVGGDLGATGLALAEMQGWPGVDSAAASAPLMVARR